MMQRTDSGLLVPRQRGIVVPGRDFPYPREKRRASYISSGWNKRNFNLNFGAQSNVIPPPDPLYLWKTTATVNAGTPPAANFSEENAVYTVPNIANFDFRGIVSNSPLPAGKTYCELELISKTSASLYVGFGLTSATSLENFDPSAIGNSNWGASTRQPDAGSGCGFGNTFTSNNGSYATNAAYSFLAGDRLMVCFDSVTNRLWCGKNGLWIGGGDPANNLNPTMTCNGLTSDIRFKLGAYTCNTSGSFVAKIYPSQYVQQYPAPAGFNCYDPA